MADASSRRRAVGLVVVVAMGVGGLLAACEATGSPSPRVTDASTPTATASPSPRATLPASPDPTATPEPALSLALPEGRDDRRVRVEVAPEVAADGDGRITLMVTNLSAERVVELVLRWPTELGETLFLAPFEPSQQRIAQGGPPLLQEWTKWVEGPGENDEPAGTTSLGWGPLDPGATLEIPILVTRRAQGPVTFDLQVLAGESVLSLEDGTAADLRVEVP